MARSLVNYLGITSTDDDPSTTDGSDRYENIVSRQYGEFQKAKEG